eukprot:6492200-Amphidinium_carterae.3
MHERSSLTAHRLNKAADLACRTGKKGQGSIELQLRGQGNIELQLRCQPLCFLSLSIGQGDIEPQLMCDSVAQMTGRSSWKIHPLPHTDYPKCTHWLPGHEHVQASKGGGLCSVPAPTTLGYSSHAAAKVFIAVGPALTWPHAFCCKLKEHVDLGWQGVPVRVCMVKLDHAICTPHRMCVEVLDGSGTLPSPQTLIADHQRLACHLHEPELSGISHVVGHGLPGAHQLSKKTIQAPDLSGRCMQHRSGLDLLEPFQGQLLEFVIVDMLLLVPGKNELEDCSTPQQLVHAILLPVHSHVEHGSIEACCHSLIYDVQPVKLDLGRHKARE